MRLLNLLLCFSPPWSFRFISRYVCIFTYIYIYITYTYCDWTCFNASVKSSSFLSLLRYVFHLSMVLVQDSWWPSHWHHWALHWFFIDLRDDRCGQKRRVAPWTTKQTKWNVNTVKRDKRWRFRWFGRFAASTTRHSFFPSRYVWRWKMASVEVPDVCPARLLDFSHRQHLGLPCECSRRTCRICFRGIFAHSLPLHDLQRMPGCIGCICCSWVSRSSWCCSARGFMMTTEEIPIYFRWIEYVGPFKPIFSEILVLQLAINGSLVSVCSWTFFFGNIQPYLWHEDNQVSVRSCFF